MNTQTQVLTVNEQNWNGYWSQFVNIADERPNMESLELTPDAETLILEDGENFFIATNESYDFYGSREKITIWTNVGAMKKLHDDETGETETWLEADVPEDWHEKIFSFIK